jgi:hypothetical protein
VIGRPGRALALVLGATVLALALPGCSAPTGPRQASPVAPRPDLALTPAGWSPVSLGSVQISVPTDWLIEDPGYTCGDGVRGIVFINRSPSPPRPGTGCPAVANSLELRTGAPKTPSASHRAVVNSIPVTEASTGTGSARTGVVLALGTEVEARGPLRARVLATLTRSPLSVVLDSTVTTVPSGWRRVVFGGLRFAVPGAWSLVRQTTWGGCPYNIEAGLLELSTAQHLSAPGCPPPPETAGYLAARAGMVLDSGPLVTAAPADSTCLSRHTLRICLDPPPPPVGGFSSGHELNLLTAQVRVPGQTAVDQIEIGLTGTGVTPLDIFDSLGPARS